MSRLKHPFAVAVLTTCALGAGAAPALADGPSPLVQAIEKLQPGTDLNFNQDLDTAAGDRTAIQALVTNAAARIQAANTVARIPASSAQQAAKAEWLSGVREGVRVDVELADGVYDVLHGQRTAGYQTLESSALNALVFRENKLTSQADEALHVTFPQKATN